MSEKEYCYDKDGKRFEVGPSMKDGPMGAHVVSCPICRACQNQIFVEEKFELKCNVLEDIPQAIGRGEIFHCEHFNADRDSYDYELVKKLMEKETNNN